MSGERMRNESPPASGQSRRMAQWGGLFGGPAVAILLYVLLPTSYTDATDAAVPFDSAGRATLAILTWMAIWWLTEAIDLSATALLPLAVFPLAGVATMTDAAAPYAHPLIFLFLGGFLQALSMQRWGLDRRIALTTLRFVGTRPTDMVAGFMLVTAVLSAFVSNTATTAMMLPIAASVVALATARLPKEASQDSAAARSVKNFATCLMLGVAYAASIGGVTTLIGTPPNVFLASFLRDMIAEPYRFEIGFLSWMAIAVPFAIVLLPLVWLLLTRIVFPIEINAIDGGRRLIDTELASIGRPKRGEWITLVVFSITAVLWMSRPFLTDWNFAVDGEVYAPLAGLSDGGIAIGGALLLFVIPVDVPSRKFTMDWQTASNLPWGILVLFGGGLSLASAVTANGVAEFLASLTRSISAVPQFAIILAVITAIVFLTELTSNLATAATLLPILAAVAPGMGLHPYLLVIPAAIAASCAFMLPVATPPNAIVFGSGQVTLGQMMRAGVWLNLISIALIGLLAVTLIPFFIRSWL